MKAWEHYYYVNYDGKIKDRLNKFEFIDIYNLINSNHYHTEIEAEAEVNHQMKVYNSYVDNNKKRWD